MLPLADVACSVLLALNAAAGPPVIGTDSSGMPITHAVALQRLEPPQELQRELQQDTIRRRARAVVYSDAYGKRLAIHRTLSWAMLPLFAASYASGDQLLKKGSDAPAWARNLHGPAASGSAVLFGANAITGAWNLWDSRSDPNGRTRRIVHSVLFTAASAGFVYAGTQLADEAEQSQDKRLQHRNIALGSMGVSTVSWLIMLIGN